MPERRRRRTPGPVVAAGALAALCALVVVAGPLLGGPGRAVQAQDLDRQQLAIERQLRCPQCTNERLDACQLDICEDMRRVIAERLAAGDHPDDIMLYFTQRFGDEIRWGLEPRGFNLVLWGWSGASLLLVAAAGGWLLWRMRGTAAAPPAAASATPAPPLPEAVDRWLDAQLGRGAPADDAPTDDAPGPGKPGAGPPGTSA